ncbi:MAG: hypothetical protein Q9191_006145, partial [Dirinaria sp. TL-2023a]
MAFLRAIEDRADDGEMDFLDHPEGDEQGEGGTHEVTGSQSQPVATESEGGTKRKRPLEESLPNSANRPPPAARRTKGRRPATLAEIRESVSFLIETPESASFVTENASSASNSEDENGLPNNETTHMGGNEGDNNTTTSMLPPPAPSTRRTNKNPSFTDRLALLRASTSTSSLSTRMAFGPDTSTTSTTFKVPTLLRRATTSSLDPTTSVPDYNGISATEQAAGGGGGKAGG